jgi:hypothetical protein
MPSKADPRRVCVCSTGLSADVKHRVRSCVEAMGASLAWSFTGDLTEQVTHLVAAAPGSQKYQVCPAAACAACMVERVGVPGMPRWLRSAGYH